MQENTVIKGFTKYSLTQKGKVISNITGQVLTEKKGTGKYYILNDEGKRVLIKLDDIKLIVAKSQLKPKPYKVFSYMKIIIRHNGGQSPEEIANELAIDVKKVKRTIKRYARGRYKKQA